MTVEISPAQARAYMIGQLGLRAMRAERGADGSRAMLNALRCIQLDPLDRVGTNADLVTWARVEDAPRGHVYDHLMPGHAFEHFAKERCILPASAYPYYRDGLQLTHWWSQQRRLDMLPEGVVERVLAQLDAEGPLLEGDLEQHGAVDPLWIGGGGWGGTKRATKMALEVLWARGHALVVGRATRGKRYDVPRRALPDWHDAPCADTFNRWALLERVEACGLLSTNAGPHWSILADVRTSTLPADLVSEGLLQEVRITGPPRRYYAPAGFLDRTFPDDDGLMRVLGPLDPLIWDRKLVAHIFGFEYVWEVYKPAAERRWGYYVCPLLHHGQLVARFEGRRDGGEVVADNLWREDGAAWDADAWRVCLDRLSSLQ
jgi:uncharacterized protein YcaQ